LPSFYSKNLVQKVMPAPQCRRDASLGNAMRPLSAAICIFLFAAAPLAADARSHGHGHAYSHGSRPSYSHRSTHTRDRTSIFPRAEYIPVEPLPLSVRCGYHLRDWRGRYIRCSAARAAFERDHPCPSTGQPRGACPGYVVDHIVPIKRGGADLPSNMQWQTLEEAKAKDKVE
jgi:5-methylcytosine-specific restriction endonuclease McrA